MPLSSYWLSRPEFNPEPHRKEFEAALDDALAVGTGTPPNVGAWAWLSWLCEEQGFVAHGTGQNDIEMFETRQSNDVSWFGNRKAVYASSDAIWAMFFAVMDRPAVPMKIVNAVVSLELQGKEERRYFFGASRSAVEQRAFRQGWVYLLPGHTFEREPADTTSGVALESHHLASLEPVRPSFRVAVEPADFPFLDHIYPYDEGDRSADHGNDPSGVPWVTPD